MFGSKRPKREFQPGSHATIYLIGAVYLGYLIFELVQSYRAGGDGAPTTAFLIGGVALLGLGMAALVGLAWWMSKQPPKKGDSEPPAQTDAAEESGEPGEGGGEPDNDAQRAGQNDGQTESGAEDFE